MSATSGHVFRVDRARGPVWYAKYLLPDGRQVQKELGPAWTGRGRPPAGYVTKRQAEEWPRLTAALDSEARGWSWPLSNQTGYLTPMPVALGPAAKRRQAGRVGPPRYGLKMTEPVRLPRAGEATIPTAKLVSYALDLTHERGRHKARVFASALGIVAGDWRYLHDQILLNLPGGEVRSTRITAFGVAYEVVLSIDGLNGRTLPVVTTWMVASAAPPRLTSTWVDIP